MKTFRRIAVVGLLALSAATSAQGQIMSIDARQTKLEAAQALLNKQVRPIESELLAVAPCPFRLDLGIRVEAPVEEAKVVEVKDMLPLLASRINPTGIFAFGGENYLVFRERRVKAGTSMPVHYNGIDYEVLITEITGVTYNVRYGDSEVQLKLK